MNRYRDWFEQAERDLERESIDIKYEFWEWACFTAQQAAEKATKALLMERGHSGLGARYYTDVAIPGQRNSAT